MRTGAGPPPAGPGVMPTPARRSRSTGGGVLARPGRAQAGPRAPGTGPSSGAPPRTGGCGRPGAAGGAWLWAGAAGGEAAADPPRARASSCPSPTPPRMCTLAGHCRSAPRRAGTVARREAGRAPRQARPGQAGLRSARARPRRTKGRVAGPGAQSRAGTQSGGGSVWAGARPRQWRGPWGVARR